jgi:hypothetical protein
MIDAGHRASEEMAMITRCPNCGALHETTTELANTPLWYDAKAHWCRKCLGLPDRPERLSERERRLRRHYEENEFGSPE